ncbi:hypothetical protein BOTBODRAFT_117913 [Botryobasidium botryosum FD-172 SS1]|uniref:Sec63-domain-containing protein n=1 Tax=Botryobasidium botryosum (strain FD-172 SS1) TaxID=930990 RepID=A0A067LZI1_BOTB1|nr:hypothetical protein BOTBODRAFT_117913 [Botryobasidium botryosum FD-172 SS1]
MRVAFTEDGKPILTADEAKRNLEASLRVGQSRPLFSGTAVQAPKYPNVYSSTAHGTILSSTGSKFMLPIGTTREDDERCEEVVIPPARVIPMRATEKLIPITKLDPLARGAFPSYYTTLNRIQSIVYNTAYTTNENLLVCAPTGAGKTDVAVLAILRVLDQNLATSKFTTTNLAGAIKRDDFKIIYVAPMKALAAEIVRKLGKRLAWLSIQVRELTGDMQLTRAEIAATQIIVTTPEKWDVVTRKPTGEGELASKVKLLIIDEVHLLNDDRGAVIETIVARTLRQVESTQSLIRVVGLSATLPNYVDVATFLGVSPYHGMFYFDSSFRPIPLEQHFLGIKGKAGSILARKNLDHVVYNKVLDLVREGHQVMVFVHARKETVKAAMAIRDSATFEGVLHEFDTSDHLFHGSFRREIGMSRNKEMKQLFDIGMGIHHAGMLRSDRNMMERMFEARAIKVLFCTATLAWGVNLPAHAGMIYGTQVYDSGKGAFVDLSVLDVLQIFGRAGRPGMELSGVGYLCTNIEKLDHYLDSVTSQHPIESRFHVGIVDALNAEISLGTVANIADGIQWIGYTYMFVRMQKNPMVYGMVYGEVIDDPQLGSKRSQLITTAAQTLANARMIQFDEQSGTFSITDLGRIAAKYYIRHTSIETFNKEFRPRMSEADVLRVLCMSSEFDQIQVRENEIEELKVMQDRAPCDVKDGTDTSQGKVVNILLQGYISGERVEDFALVSDTAYAAQNGGRIIRSLLEIAISRKWANASTVLMGMSKAVEKKMWPFKNPLFQCKLKMDVLYRLEERADELSVAELASKTAAELGQLIGMNEIHGKAILDAAMQFPTAALTYALRPLSSELLKIEVVVRTAFKWNAKVHGSSEPFWLWVEDSDGTYILQWMHLVFTPSTERLDVEFVIPIRGAEPPSMVRLRFVSDRWLGAEEEVDIDLTDLIMPTTARDRTPLQDLPVLSLSALRNPVLEQGYSSRLHYFNSIQTQCFWVIYNTQRNVLISAPAAGGKSLLGQVALTYPDRGAVRLRPKTNILVILPRKVAARDFADGLRDVAQHLAIHVDFVRAPAELDRYRQPCIRVTTARCLLEALSGAKTLSFLRSLSLVLLDDLESIDDTYELAVSLLAHAAQTLPVRYVGLSGVVGDPSGLADWLRIPEDCIYNFRPIDRDQSLSRTVHTFTIPPSAALLKAMAKPVYRTIRAAPPDDTTIVFVPSRGQCLAAASELITLCATEVRFGAGGFLGRNVLAEDLEPHVNGLRDTSMRDLLLHGIGVYHDGMHTEDKVLVLGLYAQSLLTVLVVPREACWTLPVRAGTVVVMGTQYSLLKPGSNERQIKNYTLLEIVRMQSFAVRHAQDGHFHLLCQAEDKDTFGKFLDQGLPIESDLLQSATLQSWIQDRQRDGSMKRKQDAVDMLSFTLLFRRLESNPTYYNAQANGRAEALSRLVDEAWVEQPRQEEPRAASTSAG